MQAPIASTLRRLVAATCCAVLLGGAAQAAEPKADLKPEAGTFKMGMQPWLGYGQWYVAEQAGAFKANGLDKVELVNFTEDKDMNAALASGQIDGGNLATHTAMAMVAAGLPVKIVLLLDQSTSADALIVDPSIKTKTRGGQTQISNESSYRTLDLSFEYLSVDERNGLVELESLALFIRYMLTVNAPLPEGDKASQAIGRDRFAAFVERVGRQMATGRSILLPEDGQ